MPRHPEVRGAGRAAASPRPRVARMTAAAGAVLVTVVAVLGGMGVLPVERATAGVGAQQTRSGVRLPSAPASSTPTSGPTSTPGAGEGAMALSGGDYVPGIPVRKPAAARTAGQDAPSGVPAGSGSGRRVVFDMTDQRVWLVGRQAGKDVVRRTYLVSGSVTHNLEPGTYHVYSKSLHAWGVDDSGSMRYMVRFTRGANAAIGFHDIPVLGGAPVQSRDQLGTPQSHGCIRQWRPDAQALWRFAPVGTTVVVVA